MSKPRCSERDLGYKHFFFALPSFVDALEIINGSHAETESFERKFYKKLGL